MRLKEVINVNEKKFRILSFDGGGIRGALSVSILDHILKYHYDLLENTDLIGGTSTGALIALGLAYGLDIEEVRNLYSYENGKFIFSDKHSEVLRPKYDNDNLKKVLLDVFPKNLKLGDLKKMVMIPSLYIGDRDEPWRPIFYNNMPNSLTADYNVVDVALQSSAAPVYFPSYNRHIDGGIIAADPSLACLVYTLDMNEETHLDDIKLLSIGTGFDNNSITGDTTDWGAVEWMINKEPSLPILSITLAGNSLVSQSFSQKLLKDNYYRIDPKLEQNVAMDDYESLDYLISVGDNYYIGHVLNWLGMKWG